MNIAVGAVFILFAGLAFAEQAITPSAEAWEYRIVINTREANEIIRDPTNNCQPDSALAVWGKLGWDVQFYSQHPENGKGEPVTEGMVIFNAPKGPKTATILLRSSTLHILLKRRVPHEMANKSCPK